MCECASVVCCTLVLFLYVFVLCMLHIKKTPNTNLKHRVAAICISGVCSLDIASCICKGSLLLLVLMAAMLIWCLCQYHVQAASWAVYRLSGTSPLSTSTSTFALGLLSSAKGSSETPAALTRGPVIGGSGFPQTMADHPQD